MRYLIFWETGGSAGGGEDRSWRGDGERRFCVGGRLGVLGPGKKRGSSFRSRLVVHLRGTGLTMTGPACLVSPDSASSVSLEERRMAVSLLVPVPLPLPLSKGAGVADEARPTPARWPMPVDSLWPDC